MKKMKISIGNDHAGLELKEVIKSYLEIKGHNISNHGTNVSDSVDYPDFVHPVADEVENGKTDLGIVICGSGNGAAMTANKHQKVRAALCWTVEISRLSRTHNDANVISIPARFIKAEVALEMVDAFISTTFKGGRHKNRINKIACK